MGTGTAGAILGLSTLSFHDQPSNHLNNVVIGTATGAIVGVALAMYFTITDSTTFEEYTGSPPPPRKPIFRDNDTEYKPSDKDREKNKKHQDNTIIDNGNTEDDGYIPPQSTNKKIKDYNKFSVASINLPRQLAMPIQQELPNGTLLYANLLQINF